MAGGRSHIHIKEKPRNNKELYTVVSFAFKSLFHYLSIRYLTIGTTYRHSSRFPTEEPFNLTGQRCGIKRLMNHPLRAQCIQIAPVHRSRLSGQKDDGN